MLKTCSEEIIKLWYTISVNECWLIKVVRLYLYRELMLGGNKLNIIITNYILWVQSVMTVKAKSA